MDAFITAASGIRWDGCVYYIETKVPENIVFDLDIIAAASAHIRSAGIGEEFGWRGFLLPRLQTRHNALISSLIVGVMWAIWHIPMFFIKGTGQYDIQSEGGLLPAILGYSIFVIFSSIQFTWVFNNTRGSVLLVAVMHGASNTWGGYIDVFRGHFGGILTFVVLSVLVSIIIVLMAGATNLSRTYKRNVLELEGGQPDRAQSPKVGVVQPAGHQ